MATNVYIKAVNVTFSMKIHYSITESTTGVANPPTKTITDNNHSITYPYFTNTQPNTDFITLYQHGPQQTDGRLISFISNPLTCNASDGVSTTIGQFFGTLYGTYDPNNGTFIYMGIHIYKFVGKNSNNVMTAYNVSNVSLTNGSRVGSFNISASYTSITDGPYSANRTIGPPQIGITLDFLDGPAIQPNTSDILRLPAYY